MFARWGVVGRNVHRTRSGTIHPSLFVTKRSASGSPMALSGRVAVRGVRANS